jgi:hypothetical protein
MEMHSMMAVGGADRTGRMLRVGSLFAALCAAGCSGTPEDGVAGDGVTDTVQQALDYPICTPGCPIPNWNRVTLQGEIWSCFCLPEVPPPPMPVQNVALLPGTEVQQSSTAYYGDANRAVDGNNEGNYWYYSVTHTDNIAVQPGAPGSTHYQQWWYVYLGALRHVHRVTIWNRTDCCAERLGSFSIWGITNSGWVELGGVVMNSDRVVDFDIIDTSVWTIYVQKNDSNYLSLAEVEVWGH